MAYLERFENEVIQERHPLSKAISDKQCETGCKLVLFTRRKSHMGF